MKSENGLTRVARTLRRLARVRLLFVLIALLLVPALALPFAEQLRSEWVRYWEPRTDARSEMEALEDIEIPLTLTEVRLLESTDIGVGGCWIVIPTPVDRPDDFENPDARLESVLIDFSDEPPRALNVGETNASGRFPRSADVRPDLAGASER